MASPSSEQATTVVIERGALNVLIHALISAGYQVIGPTVGEGAIVYEPLESAEALPVGWIDQQDGGRYRLVKSGRDACFDYVVGPQTWKRYLYPPNQRLWQTQRRGKGFRVKEPVAEIPAYAFFGVRSCEIHAMQIQDRVFSEGRFTDPGYLARRERVFIVAVNCAHPAGSCFCASMNTGPKATGGYDLALTELMDDKRHDFLGEAGSAEGAALLDNLPHRVAGADDIALAGETVAKAAQAMRREMIPEVAGLLKRNLEHPRWRQVAQRCLSCANCTMVCPTCFCTTAEDVTDLAGDTAERWRRWDSCFTLDFSYIHGGSIRREARSRYRQWMTHKLSTWHEQFGCSGCVGCGRCLTWCPVGIDITEEARAIRDSEEGKHHGRD